MSPFIGNPIGFNPATLALLDAALSDMCADFQRAKAKSPIAEHPAPVISKIEIRRPRPSKALASVMARRRTAQKTAGGLCFDKSRGWYLR